MRRFPQRYDARIADDAFEGLEVGKAVASLDRAQANRVTAHPIDRRVGLLRNERGDPEANQGNEDEQRMTMHVATPSD
jgi:hypothetical protein